MMSARNALRAVAMGAYDFYQKPVDADVLRLLVDRASNLYALERENRELLACQMHTPLRGVITGSAAMSSRSAATLKNCPDQCQCAVGESGTGRNCWRGRMS